MLSEGLLSRGSQDSVCTEKNGYNYSEGNGLAWGDLKAGGFLTDKHIGGWEKRGQLAELGDQLIKTAGQQKE
jgi:hypothetical protein